MTTRPTGATPRRAICCTSPTPHARPSTTRCWPTRRRCLPLFRAATTTLFSFCPGCTQTDVSTSTLRTVLKELGYRTYGWQLGRNVGPTSKVVHGMRARLDYLTNRYQRPVTLIGWSLGGIYARQLARRTPQAVRQVITLSSPIRLCAVRTKPRQPAVSSLRPRAHRALEFAARTRRRPASGSRHVDLHPARRDRRMADLPGRAFASRGEHRSSRQPPRHRQSPSGALGDRGPSRPARRPMETVSTAVRCCGRPT